MSKAKKLLEEVQKVEELNGSDQVQMTSGRYEGMRGLLLSKNEDGTLTVQFGDAPIVVQASEAQIID